MILLIAIYVFLMLTSHIKGYLHYSKHMNYKWNPLQFPNTKVYTIITFDDIGWNKIINQTNSDSNEDDNDYIDFIISMTRQCFYDAFGYTVSTMNPMTTTTQETVRTPTQSPTQYPIRSNRRYRYNRRLLNNNNNEDEYDKFFKNKIAFKNIKKSLLSGNRFNYTFGILFNDMIVFDEYMLISLDINHEYQLLRAVFYQCLYLTLNVKHIQLHIMSLSEGIYDEDSSDIDGSDEINKNEYNNTNLNGNNGDLIVDLHPTTTQTSIEYNVMITLNDNCLRNKGGMYVKDIIIEEIITFYSNCLSWKDNDNNLKYKTYHVSDIEMVYFFKIIDNDRSCLIDIDMQYLEHKCVDNIEYEPVYKLDIIYNGYSAQCDALNISNLNV